MINWSKGDCAVARCDVKLESGGMLRANQRGHIFAVVPDDPTVVGFQWTDRDGNHAMALATGKLYERQ
jgi:hypothetical protein